MKEEKAMGWVMKVQHKTFPQYSFKVENPAYVPRVGERIAFELNPYPTVTNVGYDYEKKEIIVLVN
jgi:hypothetical protein